ncbi:hypothetical protein AcV7_006560 [Taiwanofungus camphoratus]|nr:hypothetical protein AcV7_006560 [Antrodia cinnamomea]
MSFLAQPQRGYDSVTHSDLSQLSSVHTPNSRIPMHPISSFDNLPLQTPPPLSSNSAAQSAAQASDRSGGTLPRVGQTRCYWSLLTPELSFLYLDPVLASHLGEQADLLIGKSLLAFVHPDEQSSAKADLGSVLESRTLHGSVTRVRFSRLSRVRRQLGYQGRVEGWADAEKVSVDENYLAIDIVINWASDGLVLCFMHAVVDLTPRDNDELNKTSWTNWCGTPYMSVDQVHLLYQRLISAMPHPPPMSRVFQILVNHPERALALSWPPDQEQGGPTSKDFAKLAQDVQISTAISSGTDAKTSCTRRYKAHQTMHFGVDGSREVESIFIPHGYIIFACHKVNVVTREEMSSNNSVSQSAYNSHQYSSQPSQHYYDQPHSYSLPPVPAPSSYSNCFSSQAPHHAHSQYSSGWSHTSEPSASQAQYNNWSSQSTSLSSAPSVSSVRSSSYSAPQQQHQWSSQPPSYIDANPAAPASYSHPAPSPPLPYQAAAGGHEGTPPSPASDHVPPPRVTQRRGSGNTREQYGGGGRSSGNPPVGVSRCSSCKVTHSPEWRKGPSGKKDLCNACGLRFARSRAKKEGGPSHRRRKDRAFSTMSIKSEHSPSTTPVNVPYSGIRRGSLYDDGSFVSTSSNGSPSNEMYSQHPNHANGATPSPSPPSGNMHYVPYSQHSAHHHQNSQIDNRSHFGTHGNTFYSVPPPLPNQAMHHMTNNNHSHSSNAVPRLEPVMAFTNRLSPLVSPSSPASTSPLSASLSSASFEREKHAKDHDRVLLPPTPVSAESRHPSSKTSYMNQ